MKSQNCIYLTKNFGGVSYYINLIQPSSWTFATTVFGKYLRSFCRYQMDYFLQNICTDTLFLKVDFVFDKSVYPGLFALVVLQLSNLYDKRASL